ncbi:DUF1367 family protein [Marinobacter sp. JSM 1782161]|uniref:DUF1367 family protein n=1 Tax=Marinobacter sp. JSM 1782161 TaxID=2685906 RepID=UPI00140288BE|nr:DUF1367 family protein [Marinobacter sp. JSM 1782161]
MTGRHRRPERFPLRVKKGGFVPADVSARARLRDKGFRTGDLVFVEFRKPRNPRFHRLAHALGRLCSENIDAFTGMDPHQVLKRLQIEAQIGCEEMAIVVPGVGKCLHLIPRSLGFESMDDGEFHEVIAGFCRHIAKNYWPTLEPEKIEEMAGLMVGDS